MPESGYTAFVLPPIQLILSLALNAALSSFQDGYYLGVINNPTNTLQNFTDSSFQSHYGYPLDKSDSSAMWSFIVALYTVGGIIGSWSTIWLVDRLGRKFTIMVLNNIVAIAACLMSGLCFLANSFELLAASRFMIGYNSGLATGALGLYLTECSPVKFRGFFGSFLNFAITFFTLVSAVLSLDFVFGATNQLPYLLGLGIIPAILQIVFSPFFPETPKYLLLAKKDEEKARKSVLYYYGKDENVDLVFEEFRREEKLAAEQVGLIEAFRDERFRFPIVLSSVINIAQVSTGIIAIFSYSSIIFESVGFPADQAQLVTTIMSSFNTVGAIAGLYLIESWGRRPLMLYGTLICLICDVVFMFLYFAYQQTCETTCAPTCAPTWVTTCAPTCVTTCVTTIGYFCAAMLVIHVTIFNMGVGPIAWFISSELMPQSARSIGASVSVTINWIMALITSFAFDQLNDAVGPWSFLLFIIPLVPCLIYMWMKVPETKNKHIDELMSIWYKMPAVMDIKEIEKKF